MALLQTKSPFGAFIFKSVFSGMYSKVTKKENCWLVYILIFLMEHAEVMKA